MDSGEGAAVVRRRPLAAIRTERRRDHDMREEEEEEEEEGEPMSPAARLFHEPSFNCHILAIMGSGKRIDVAVAKAGVRATLARHPRFSSVQVLDEAAGGKKARWVRAVVDVDKHLVIPDLAQLPDAGATGDKLVEDYVAALSRIPLDHSRPLWDLHVLNVPTSEAAATAVLRIHHSLGDGTSLMSLLLACFRKTSDPDALPTLHGADPRSPPLADPGGCSAWFPLLLRWAWALLSLLWNTAVDAARFAATAVFLKDSETPLKGAEGTEFRPKRFVHCSVSLDDLKTIKNAMNCKINDVLVGVSAAGLSRYLTRKYGEGGKKLPENLRIRSTLLVNMRPAPTIDAMASMMEDGKKSSSSDGKWWGNMLGYLLLPFSVEMQEDPLEYVRKGRDIAERKKNSLEAVFTFRSAEFFFKLFGLKAASALSYRILSNTTLSFSNIIGPSEEIEIYGHPLVFLAPTTYGHPHALTINFISYMETVRIVLAVDESTIPDPHQLLDDLVAALSLIKQSIPAASIY